jgi:hypothetical protein
VDLAIDTCMDFSQRIVIRRQFSAPGFKHQPGRWRQPKFLRLDHGKKEVGRKAGEAEPEPGGPSALSKDPTKNWFRGWGQIKLTKPRVISLALVETLSMFSKMIKRPPSFRVPWRWIWPTNRIKITRISSGQLSKEADFSISYHQNLCFACNRD